MTLHGGAKQLIACVIRERLESVKNSKYLATRFVIVAVTVFGLTSFVEPADAAWTDKQLLHNANHFACSIDGYLTQVDCETNGGTWDIARKWANGWGTDTVGAKYGPIVCGTCHTRGATNIKMVVTTLTAPNSPTDNFPGSTVSFLDATANNADVATNPADFGDDSDGRGAMLSQRICEGCHSVTTYHRATTDVIGNPDHYNKQDCIVCHQHNKGFKATCSDCHGNPPTTNDNNGSTRTGLLHTPAPTGSVLSGAHNRHLLDVTGPQYDCSVCHGIPFGRGVNHTGAGSGALTIDFNAFGTTGNSVAGTYAGQISVNTGAGYDGDNVGIPDNTLDCNNVYCHGGTIGGGVPKWSDLSAPCGSCHAATAANPPANPASGTSHATHAGSALATGSTNIYRGGAIGLSCNNCHGAGAGGSSHVNGEVGYDVTALTKDYQTVSAPAYNGVTNGNSAGLAPSNPYQTCSNLLCHWGTTTPLWNNGPADCTICHSGATTGGTGAPDTGQHAEHVLASGNYLTCDNCHGPGSQNGLHAGHIDGLLTLGGDLNVTIHNEGTLIRQNGDVNYADDDSCATACHKEADWGVNGAFGTSAVYGDATINWTGTGSCTPAQVEDLCLDCHSDMDPAYNGRSGPMVVTNWSTTPTASHLKITKADTLEGNSVVDCNNLQAWKDRCNACHTKHSGPVLVPNPPETWVLGAGTTSPLAGANMQTQLGIKYIGSTHGGTTNGGIHLGGTSTGAATTEAEICWGCHGADADLNEWGWNTDNDGSTWPNQAMGVRRNVSAQGTVGQNAHNFGWVYTDAGMTAGNETSAWVQSGVNDGIGFYRYDAYSTTTALDRQIASVHSVNFDAAKQVSSVKTSINWGGAGNAKNTVIRTSAQEKRADIRCSYCHDVHDLALAVNDTASGKPWLRGSWLSNPYPPTVPPATGSVPSNAMTNQIVDGANTNFYTPRATSSAVNLGGYFIDQNSGNPTANVANDSNEEIAGICVLCHGGSSAAEVNSMDFYDNTVVNQNMWRTPNGHAFAALEGTAQTGNVAYDLFDPSYGISGETRPQMGMLHIRGYTNIQLGFGDFDAGNAYRQANSMKGQADVKTAAQIGWVPTANLPGLWSFDKSGLGGWQPTGTGAGANDWYQANYVPDKYHYFSCSQCHSPHATGLPALLLNNCVDQAAATWQNTATRTRTQAMNCHRKEDLGDGNNGTNTGWHVLQPGQ